MANLMPDLLHRVASPPIAADAEPPIDDVHLARMTLGDTRLEREVLALFDRQVALLIGRIAESDPEVAAATAHTLKGSAQSIGAWPVVRAAGEIEAAAGCHADLSDAVAALTASLCALRLAIAQRIRAH